MLHALNLRTSLRPTNALHLAHSLVRHYARENYGVLPKHVVEKARQTLSPNAVPVTALTKESVPQEDGSWASRSLSSLEQDERAAAKRKRRTEWKRRQGVSTFHSLSLTAVDFVSFRKGLDTNVTLIFRRKTF